MGEQQYRVIQDRDKGDLPVYADVQTHTDRVTVEQYGQPTEHIVRIERPVPTTDERTVYVSPRLATHVRGIACYEGITEGQASVLRTAADVLEQAPIVHAVAPRRNGKQSALIDTLLDRANERGIRVQIIDPSVPTYAEFESQEQELFRHKPVMSREDGGIVGCQCRDTFFRPNDEDWGTHLAVVMRSLVHPSVPTREQVAEALYRHDQHEDWLWAEEKNEATREAYLSQADAVLALIQKVTDR